MQGFVDKDFVEVEAAVAESVSTESVDYRIPVGYIPIRLTTKGRLGVPEVVHVKNFTTEDLLDLAISVDSILPTKTIQALNRCIYEKDVNVADWPEKSVIELLISIYSNFFTPFLSEIPFPWNKDDLDYLESKGRHNEALALQSGEWKPKVNIDLSTLKFIQLDPSIKDTIKISKKDGSFEATFSACPKIGDVLILKNALEKETAKTDRDWAPFKQMLELRERLIREEKYENLPIVDQTKLLEYVEYESKKQLLLIKMTQALYLKSFMKEDVSQVPLIERIKYFEDPRLDVNVSRKLETQFEKLQFGVKDEIEIDNPITLETCTRRFSFRTVDILQAIRQYDSPEYDIGYDD